MGITVGVEKPENIHIGTRATTESHVRFRTEHDATMAVLHLSGVSLHFNMRAGESPTDKKRRPMPKVPINGQQRAGG